MASAKKIIPRLSVIKILIIPVTALLPFSISAIGRHQIAKQSATDQKTVDPAAWGSSHVGKPIPEYVHGDECLFCHRNDVGGTWQDNAHGVTIRQKEDAAELAKLMEKQPPYAEQADQIEYFLGSRNHIRFLKKAGYGKFSMLNAQANLSQDRRVEKWTYTTKLVWEKDKFADRCAGCHTTGVDSMAKTFAGFGIDCYACHGDVNPEHSNDISLVWLSKKRRNDAKAIMSICAQCHLRSGKSKTSGLPYADGFIAGDNLFQDFQVDFSAADKPESNPADRHILYNVRDVVLRNKEGTTCITCHDIHTHSTKKHTSATLGPVCVVCHESDTTKKVKAFDLHSPLCEY